MSNYISRDEIFSVWRSMPKPASVSSLIDAINRTPAADAEPVRRGHLKQNPEYYVDEVGWIRWVYCLNCHSGFNFGGGKPHYCPYCGCKNDLEDDNGT